MSGEKRNLSAQDSVSATSPNIPTARLAPGCQLFIWSLRTWRRLNDDPQLPGDLLQTPYRYHGLISAVLLVEEMMALCNGDLSRQIDIVRPYRRELSDDEMNLVSALRLVSLNRQHAAESALRRMLPAPAARTFRRLLGNYTAQLRARGLLTCSAPNLRLVSCDGSAAKLNPLTPGGTA